MTLTEKYLTNIGHVLGVNNLSKNCVAITQAASAKGNSCLNDSFILSQTGSNSQILLNKIRKIESINLIHDTFMEKNFEILDKILKNTGQTEIVINVDVEKRPYYGKHKDLSLYIHNETDHRGSTGSFFYQGISVKTRYGNIFIALNLLSILDNATDKCIPILKILKERYTIKTILFDRGYNNYKLVDTLNKLKVNYMIFWKKSGKKWKELIEELPDGSSCCVKHKKCWRFLGEKFDVDAKFTIIKQLKFKDTEKKYDWIFCTNMTFTQINKYVAQYRQRWGIETAFRVFDGGEIKTTSKNRCIRQMIYCLSALIYNLWILTKSKISKDLTFTNFFEVIIQYFREKYNIKLKFKEEIIHILKDI